MFLRTLQVRWNDLDLKPRFVTSKDYQARLKIDGRVGLAEGWHTMAQLCQFSRFLVFRGGLLF